MRTYFFVPAAKFDKVRKIETLNVDEIIIDFEDAILKGDRQSYLREVVNDIHYLKYWYRTPLRSNDGTELDFSFLSQLLSSDISKVVLPKLNSAMELKQTLDFIGSLNKNCHCIVLIEHPRLLIEMGTLLSNSKYSGQIIAVGIGSHDLMNVLGAEHTSEQIFYPRMQVLYLAKAYKKEAIDIASMNIDNIQAFQEELHFGLESGYDAKFLIHPRQLAWLQNFDLIRTRQLAWANKILAGLPEDHQGEDVEPYILDGQVIEKPHVVKAKEIIKKYSNEK